MNKYFNLSRRSLHPFPKQRPTQRGLRRSGHSLSVTGNQTLSKPASPRRAELDLSQVPERRLALVGLPDRTARSDVRGHTARNARRM